MNFMTKIKNAIKENDDDVIVEVMSSGVCGTDVHIFHGDIR